MSLLAGITVTFKKTVSDGNYGNETAEVSYVIEVEDGDDRDALTLNAFQRARWEVGHELMRSENINIRRKLNPSPRICNECHQELPDDVLGYLHRECSDKQRAEREAQRALEPDMEEIPF